MNEEKPIMLTKKEAYLIWSVITWWQKPFTHKLKAKLYDFIGDEEVTKLNKKYSNFEIRGLVEAGTYIRDRHPEWMKTSNKDGGKTDDLG